MFRFTIAFALAAALAVAFVACKDRAMTKLDDLITDKVIEVAVASFAEDVRAGEARNWSYAEHFGPTWTANTKVRHAVFAEHLGAGWFDLVYDNKTNFREYAMRTARESLDTPEELRAEYLRHKAKVIAEIEKQGIQDYVVRCANIVRFHFSPDGEVFADPYTDRGAKEWAGRRRTEGGGALVAAWGEIIADLANSL